MTDMPANGILPTRDAGSSPRVSDVLLGLGVAVTVSLMIAADVQSTNPDGWAYLWAVGLGGLMLARRRHPVLVVVLSAAAVVTYHAAGYSTIGIAVPLAAAVFSAAERGRLVAAIVAPAVVLTIATVYRIAVGQDAGLIFGYELPAQALLLAGAVAFGDSVRSRRDLRRRADEIAELVSERAVQDAEKRAVSERLAIARELHDSVGHALTVVALHAEIADEALESSPSDRRDAVIGDALRVIDETTSSTFVDVRRTVASLRRGDEARRPPLRITDLAAAVAPARQAGLEVHTHVHVTASLPGDVEAAVYRIVQEAITNVVRHAAAKTVNVDVRQSDAEVTIAVVDDGVAGHADAPVRSGGGLAGMRERATLLGGTFAAGQHGTGFAVHTSLPLEARG